jgi:DNA-binding response OmpR family regulator
MLADVAMATMGRSILIVEDQPQLAEALSKCLREEGFNVDVAGNGFDGRRLALANEYDLVVLDLKLPGVDGFSLLRLLRASNAVPVMVVSAVDSMEDRLYCLRNGANDFLQKPFALAEFLARVSVHAHPLRAARPQPSQFAVNGLRLDTSRRRAEREGRRLDLTSREFLLLSVLMETPGEVVPRSVLAKRVWNIGFDQGSNVIEVAIRRLRTKVDDPFPCKLLHTVRGMGYVVESRDADQH